jgi:CheY-like chemotaxis protein
MSYTLLLVEDEAPLLAMLQKDLQERGFMVLTASNGSAAIFVATQYKPDLIIMDVAMPMTNGLKAFEKIRANPETLRIPVIFLTGLPSKEVYPTVEQGSRVAHLKKPVDIDDLMSLINQFLPKK